MKLDRFVAERQQAWRALEALVEEAGGRPHSLGSERLQRMGILYRSAAADLAAARLHFPHQDVVDRLERLVLRSRRLVYSRSPRRFFPTAWKYMTTGYYQCIAERPVPLLLSALLLFGAAALAWIWATVDPAAAAGEVPWGFQDVLEPGVHGTDMGMTGVEQAAFSWYLFTHNTLVTFLAFGLGMAFGLGTAYVLVDNGIILGVIGGVLFGSGNGDFLLELVAAHGVLELSCIVVAGAAGLRVGWSILAPGHLSRGESVAAEGRKVAGLVAGTMPWLLLAGIIEGVVSRRGLDATSCVVVGVSVGAVFWGLVWGRGRNSDPAEFFGA